MLTSFSHALREPLLEVDEEREAILRWQRDKDSAALELLVRSHARQVWSLARRWTDNPAHLEDLVAEGVIGLIRAAENFDTARDVRFSTYAAWWVRNELAAAVKRIRGALISRMEGSSPIDARLAGISAGGAHSPDALQAELEAIASDEASPEEDAMRRSDEAMMVARLHQAMSELSQVEAEVIQRRRLMPDPEPMSVIASDLATSPARLRQIETRALARLRQKLIAQGFTLSVLH
ncbi:MULTISPECIES: sigma-70 family RNA polymerase sigma factor [unclassified Roseivivax]|uniref:sigma-70 family RNA polymerase sigma factor n=1 Tax=Roseivivax sp. GX 12232 TaxID=2900547 RepID=UPI001E3C3354|nr:sigma-70 family RNA polymerase sigma factor [Roseivivax sp. GX 12232]MCE0503899.1 sigma-70 family RNA polymerase sigma factor [Roseivivax sp. GX 12232]